MMVVMNTPNQLYRGVVAKIVRIDPGIDRDAKCVRVQIDGALVGMPGIQTYEYVRPSQLTAIEHLDREGGCEG